jgi:acetate kinase
VRTPVSILTVNGGSSSIKFAVYRVDTALQRTLQGAVEWSAADGARLSWRTPESDAREERFGAPDQQNGPGLLVEWLRTRPELAALSAVGHRVVHGMTHTQDARITPDVLADLRRFTPYAPEHLPTEIALIEALGDAYSHLPQVACFDTGFHRHMPRVATLLPIPRRYLAKGVQRYGFHGLSYSYLMEELSRLAEPQSGARRVILAHLGNGASLAAVRDGTGVETSMGFTPAAGLVMSTRTGDLDPGVVSFLARTEGMDAARFDHMVNHESGLLGVSEISSDMRELLRREPDDARAADAVALFCYQAKKWVGALAAVLGGLDTLVFSAGIGERSAAIRGRICDGLGFLGITLDEARNAAHEAVISTAGSRVTVRVVPTNEELMIARSTARVLDLAPFHPEA